MAIGTKKKPQPKTSAPGKARTNATVVGKAKPKQRSAAKRPAASAIHEPDRAAPPMAEIDADALEFIEAIDRFKKQNARPFPSWSEVLLVVRQLGYRRR